MQTWLIRASGDLRDLRLNLFQISLQPIPGYIVSLLTVTDYRSDV